MSDNTTLPPGGGGDTIRTMDRTTSKTQVVALDFGPDAGPENLVSASNGLPVAQILGSVWTVTGTGTFSVSGTVAVSSVGGTVNTEVTNFPATQPISAAALPLPTNAAQEAGGNLALLLANEQANIVPLLLQILMEMRMANFYLQSGLNVTTEPDTLRADPYFNQ